MMTLPDLFRVPTRGPVNCEVVIPGSKSLTNRALLLAALARGTSQLTGVLDSEDTRMMADALHNLGVQLRNDPARGTCSLVGCPQGFPVRDTELYVGNSGTTARFLTAALAPMQGHYRIHGKPRMHERPIGDLLHTLTALGASVRSENGNDCPPVLIDPAGKLSGETEVAAQVSSQFLSALLMMAPLTGPVTLRLDGDPVSRPYIEMTLAVMNSFGIPVATGPDFRSFAFPGGQEYQATEYAIEPDASAASYFFAVPALVGGRVTVQGLSRRSLQGDVGFVDCLAAMGCHVDWSDNAITVERRVRPDGSLDPLIGIDVDMNDISDTVQTLAVVALFAESPTRIHNVAHIRHKETDRISALVQELRRFQVPVEEFPDGLLIWSCEKHPPRPARVATYDDHRMAMSFALAGLVLDGVEIEHPACVAKTFPHFWDTLAQLS